MADLAGAAVAKRKEVTSIFAIRLAQARVREGLSQTQLGVLAGFDPSVASPRINQYERGKHEPQQKTVKQLADVLGVPAAFLYTDDDLLAELLLRWNGLTQQQKRELVAQAASKPSSKDAR